jgi:hypothetical protein
MTALELTPDTIAPPPQDTAVSEAETERVVKLKHVFRAAAVQEELNARRLPVQEAMERVSGGRGPALRFPWHPRAPNPTLCGTCGAPAGLLLQPGGLFPALHRKSVGADLGPRTPPPPLPHAPDAPPASPLSDSPCTTVWRCATRASR